MADFSNEFFAAMTSSSNDKRNRYFVDFINRLDNKSLLLNNKTYDTYFLSFEILSDITDPSVKKLGFKAYRKLVAMRAMSGLMKYQEARSIAVICFSNLGDSNVMSRCTRIIDDVFYSFIKEFTLVLSDIIIPSHDYHVLLGTVNWLLQPQILQDKVFDFANIVPSIISAMNAIYLKKADVYQLLTKLIDGFFHNSSRIGAANKIAYNEVQNPTIASKVRNDVLSIIEVRPKAFQTEGMKLPYSSSDKQEAQADYTAYAQLGLKSPFVTDKSKTDKAEISIPPETKTDLDQSLEEAHLSSLIEKLDQYEIEEALELSPIDDCDLTDLSRISKKYLAFFNGKESEQNWSVREECIRQLRRIVRGNIVNDHLDDFKAFIINFVDAIAKSVESLRTTLSSSACHLIKEMAIILKSHFDSLTDLFFQPLINVCLRKKSITSRLAHTAISAIFINCSYHQKFIVKIKAWSGERNDTVFHAFCTKWLQILIIRFHAVPSLFNKVSTQYTSGPRVPLLHEMLKSLLSDANALVRQAAREAFWEVCTFSPKDMQLIFSSVDGKTQKMIEREKPSFVSLHDTKPESKQPKLSRNPSLIRLAIAPTQTLSQKVLSRASSRSSSLRGISRTSSLINKTSTTRPPSRTIPSASYGYGNADTISSTSSFKTVNKTDQTSSRSVVSKPTIQKSSSKLASVSGISDVPHYARPTKAQEQMQRGVTKSQPNRNDSVKTTPVPKHMDEASIEISYKMNTTSEFPLVDQLTSHDSFTISQGINGLKYALKYNEESEIPLNIDYVISDLSKSHVQELRPLFDYTGIPKILRAFKAEDFLRVSSIIFDSVPAEFESHVSLFYGTKTLYEAINKVLEDCIASIAILRVDARYGKQLALHKPSIILFMLLLLHNNVEASASEEYFPLLSSNLFKLFKLIPAEFFDTYSKILKELSAKNPETFNRCLESFAMDYKTHIQNIVTERSSQLPSYEPSEELLQDSDDELDIVTQEHEQSDSQNDEESMKVDSIEHISVEPKNEEPFSSNQEDPIAIDQDEADMGTELVEADDIISIHAEMNDQKNGTTNEDMEVDDIKDFDSEPNAFLESKSSRRGSSLADEFSQIEIIDKKSFEIKDPYQTLVERVDPLKAKSERGKQISIYQDKSQSDSSTRGSTSGSPVKPMDVSSHDYSELNWFNFQLAHNPKKIENDVNQTDYERLCETLANNLISNEEVIELVNILQCSMEFGIEFTNYFCKKGKIKLETSLWNYFGALESYWKENTDTEVGNTKVQISNGLLIIKQSLISNINLDVYKLMTNLYLLSNHTNEMIHEINYAISEIFDELFKKTYFEFKDIYNKITVEVKGLTAEDEKNKILITFEVLLKLLSKYNVYSTTSSSSITDFIDNDVNRFLKHKEVDVRRLIVLIYAKFSNLATHEPKDFLDKLNVSQRKLVEYYSKNL